MFEYLDFLQTPNPTFNNMPICPFIAGDLQTGNIKFMVYNSEMDTSLIEMIQEWEQSNFKTGLILHVGDDMKSVKRKPYQKFLNEELKKNQMGDIKILCFSPFEDFNISGVDTRYGLARRPELTYQIWNPPGRAGLAWCTRCCAATARKTTAIGVALKPFLLCILLSQKS